MHVALSKCFVVAGTLDDKNSGHKRPEMDMLLVRQHTGTPLWDRQKSIYSSWQNWWLLVSTLKCSFPCTGLKVHVRRTSFCTISCRGITSTLFYLINLVIHIFTVKGYCFTNFLSNARMWQDFKHCYHVQLSQAVLKS